MSKEAHPTRKLLFITAAGAAEGAYLGSLYSIVTAGWGTPVGAAVGGATALTAELSRRAIVNKLQEQPTIPDWQTNAIPMQPVNVSMDAVFPGQHTLANVTVEATSTTQRTDSADGGAQPIVITNTEQVADVPAQNLPDVLTSVRARTLANVFPTWHTTLNEKTTASTTNTSTYELSPQRTS